MARSRWKQTEILIREAYEILAYEHPMTLRQLFYRLVSKLVIQNDHPSYQRLSRVMTDARNSGEILFEWIVDRSKPEYIPNVWDDPEDYIKTVARAYKKDRWQDQPYHVEVWLEKDSIIGSVEDICRIHGVTLRAHKGFGSTTKKHEIAEFFASLGKPVVILYVGDHDPSGQDIERDLGVKLKQYGAYDFEIERLAILKEDIALFNLPPLKIKNSDPRAKKFKSTYGSEVVEADALPPRELRYRIDSAIRELIDMDTWERAERVEAVELEAIRDIAGRFKSLIDSESLK